MRKSEPAKETKMYIFPSRLRAVMKSYGTKQKELAQAVGVKPQTISLYCLGQSFPDVNNLAKIARFFDVSADYLIGLTDSETPYIPIQQYIGLTEKAINSIRRLDKKSLDGLNQLLAGIADN